MLLASGREAHPLGNPGTGRAGCARAVQFDLQCPQRRGQLVLMHPAHVADAQDSTLQAALSAGQDDAVTVLERA